jgi:hypothetical protein
MCGKPLDDEPATEFAGPKKESNAPAPAPSEPEPAERPVPAPAYTGGIFNLGAPSESSGSVDYLLEDDEPRTGRRLFMFGLVAVALVVGLGWMRFRQTGIPGLKGLIGTSSSAKPSASTDAPPPSQPPADASSGSPADAAPAATEQPPSSGTSQTSTPAATAPSESGASPSSTATTTPPAAAAPSITPVQPSDGQGGASAQAATPEHPAPKPEEHAD